MGNMCTFGRVRKPHGHVQADARSTRMGANSAGASAGRGGQAAAVERAGSVHEDNDVIVPFPCEVVIRR